MPWPQSTDYNLAIQNPHLCFQDEDLRACTAWSADPVLGLPSPRAGNFADVYRLDHPNGESWAVKCFTREVGDLRERYAAISDHLVQAELPFIIEFRYLEDAILVDGAWYPIVKMRWVEGKNLSEFAAEQADRPANLDKLARKWLQLARELREAGIGHGDLQHGNVLLVPHPQRATFLLRLIDYDGMYVPALADRPSKEAGFPGYQHPQRPRHNLFGPEIDRFSHLVIYTALRAIRVGGSTLWERFGSPENLLFTEPDFTAPAKSELIRTLFALPDTTLRHLLGHLILAALGDPADVPLLETLLTDGVVRRLEPAQFETLRTILGSNLTGRRSKLDTRTPPHLDSLPALPSPLRETRIDSVPASEPTPEVPVARRLDRTTSLPDWMLPEAVPLGEAAGQSETTTAEDSDPETPTLHLPPLVAVPVEPVNRPPPRRQYTPVLLEESSTETASSGPTAEEEPLLVEPVDDPDEEPLDVCEVLDDPPASPVPTATPRTKPEKKRSAKESATVAPAAEEAPEEADSGSALHAVIPIALAFLLFAIVGTILVLHLRRVPESPPEPQTAKLQLPDELVIEGGNEVTLTVPIEPHGERGPFEVRLLDLPAALTAQAVPADLPPGGNPPPARFLLSAPLDVVDVSATARVQLVRGNERLDEQPLRVIVRRPDFPRFVTPIARRRIEVGGHARLAFEIDRRGRREQLQVELAELFDQFGHPIQIVQEENPISRDATTLFVNLFVKLTQARIPTTVTARLLFIPDGPGPRFEVDRTRVSLDFVRPRPARQFLSTPTPTVRIEVGKSATLRVVIDRAIYPPTVSLRVRGLPAGVTTDDREVSAAKIEGVFLLSSAPDTRVPADFVPIEIVAYDETEEIGRLAIKLRVVPAPPAP